MCLVAVDRHQGSLTAAKAVGLLEVLAGVLVFLHDEMYRRHGDLHDGNVLMKGDEPKVRFLWAA